MPFSMPPILSTAQYEQLVLDLLNTISGDGSSLSPIPSILSTAQYRHLVLEALNYIATHPASGGRGVGELWSATKSYLVGDMVSLSGVGYICILNSTGNNPSSSPTFWVRLALISDFVVCRNINIPTVSGVSLFSSTTGAWTASPTSFAYQWQISSNGTSGWSNINQATSATYQALEADNGKYVRVGVIASNAFSAGSIAYSLTSNAIDVGALTQDLLAFWKLSDTSDSTGNGNTLTNNNSVPFTPGKIGDAATVGIIQSLTRSMTFDTSQGQNWSASAWFKEFEHVDNATFLAGPDAAGMFWLWTDGSFVYATPTDYNATLGGPYTAEEWNHVVASVTSNVLTLYVNGTNIGSMEWEGSNVSTQIRIGVNVPTQEFYGQVDAVGLWTRALNSSEASILYNGGTGIELP